MEAENKRRKAQYPVAASRVPFVVQTSQTLAMFGSENNTITAIVEFTPGVLPESGNSMIGLYAEVALDSSFVTRWPRFSYGVLPQNGSGKVRVKVDIYTTFLGASYYLRVVASGPSVGVFAVV